MGHERNMRQDVTHWPVTGSDGFGGFLFGNAVLLKGRWEEKQELFLSDAGEEETSKAIVYLNADVTAGDYLALGDETASSNPGTLPTGERIRAYGKVTSLRNVQSLRKVWL